MREAVIIDGVRTPRGGGKATGALHTVHPQNLLALVLSELVKRTGVDPVLVNDVVTGNGSQVDEHANDIGRIAVLLSTLPFSVPGTTVNRFCGSGQQAVNFAAMGIMSGWQEAVIASGVESMSRYQPDYFGKPLHAGNLELRSRHPLVPQGVSADLIATLEGFTRAELDTFAARSQALAAEAITEGRFASSLVPVYGSVGELLLDHDEHPRPGTTPDTLARLKPSFEQLGRERAEPGEPTYDEICLQRYPQATAVRHVHHAGNSSGVVDGAASMLLTSSEFARAHNLRPRARIVSCATAGTEPVIMLTAPGPTAQACLDRAGMTVKDIDLWEVNEAFAAIPLKLIRDLKVDEDRVNVNGGAIALGHPIGATGVILIQTVLDELERRDLSTGLVTMCTGMGMGTATIIERV